VHFGLARDWKIFFIANRGNLYERASAEDMPRMNFGYGD
jgi:hypothetical protein